MSYDIVFYFNNRINFNDIIKLMYDRKIISSLFTYFFNWK